MTNRQILRAARLPFVLVATAGAIIGATRALLEDRSHTRHVRERLAFYFPQENQP